MTANLTETAVEQVNVGDAQFNLEIKDGFLHSLGAVTINGTPLRNSRTRWLPWFDSYEGDTFTKFRFNAVEERDGCVVISTEAISDPDALFRERRDSSGDICFRNASWDDAPQTARFDIVIQPAGTIIEGRSFSGFKYWFEYSGKVPIHRMADRQTWELGGNLDDVNIVCRNWLTPARMKIERDTEYSTVGLEQWAKLLPGNLWGRWTLLPGFDMQYGSSGTMLAWFDAVSLIRTVIETRSGENCVRHMDMHLFEQANKVRTNPRTVLWYPDVLDDVNALNLWTRVHDMEHDKSCKQFGIKEEEPPALALVQNHWRDFDFMTGYEHLMEVSEEFGADMFFIDPVWEHQEALRMWLNKAIPEEQRNGSILDKFWAQNICVTLDFEVAEVMGGEAELKKLCDRARDKGLRVISWMASHYSPNTAIHLQQELGHGAGGIFAARESGRHPDTGYPASCWTANLNAPVGEKILQQIRGVCERTGLAGFLWDSFCNIGWFQVDYSDGTMRPQFDKQARLYAELANDGLYIMPEAVVTFSNHSCCGLHGGDVYAGDLLGYSYKTNIALWYGGQDHLDTGDVQILKGEAPFDLLFRAFAHLRVPVLNLHQVPREERNAEAEAQIKELFRVYKQNREQVKKRTVLKNDAGVLWESENGDRILFSFQDQSWPGTVTDLGTSEQSTDGTIQANRVYRVEKSEKS